MVHGASNVLGKHYTAVPEVADLFSEKWMLKPSFLGDGPQRKGFRNRDVSLVGGLSTKVESPGVRPKEKRGELRVRAIIQTLCSCFLFKSPI